MRGTNSNTGAEIEGLAWIRQAITDILTTPIGTRVGRRDYGSRLFALTDSTLNQEGLLALYTATIEALNKWLVDQSGNRLMRIDRVLATVSATGKTVIEIVGTLLSDGTTALIGGIAV
ncbi:MAG: phage baseplate protein [Patescibacteria group bacterium]|jgi:hypothetical protein